MGAIFEGLFGGLCSMNVYVALKGMDYQGGRWDDAISTLMQMLPSILMAFAMVYSSGGRVRKRRSYWVFAGVFGRLSIGVVALFTNPFLFVAVVAFQSIVSAGIAPALNHIWGANCSAIARGRIFTYYSIAAELSTMLGAVIAGALLDGFHVNLPLIGEIHLYGDPRNYALLYPIAGVIGLAGMLYFWRVRLRFKPAREDDVAAPPWYERFSSAFKQARALLRRDPDFRLYEFGFFLYGTAFMMVACVVPLFFKNTLDASYTEFETTTVVLVQVMHLVSVPLIVRFASGRRVTVVTRVPFAMLMLYPILLGATALMAAHDRETAMWFAYAAFVWFGIAMACIHFVWNLGPVAFARGGNPLSYTSTHAALVGVRASVGFPLAYLFLWVFDGDLLPVFIAATLFFFGAAVVMTVLDRRLRAKGDMTNAMGR
jgi:MFS family permease